MATLHGTIIDAATGEKIDAKVHVLDASGNFHYPTGALMKRGPGTPFFFSDGVFEVPVGRGRTDILVERGTEYEPTRLVVETPASGVVDVEIPINRWYYPQEERWYPGNTHIHYDEKETRPDDRLGVDCSVEGYNVTAVSVLDRRQLPYASNKYPIGVMNEFTTAHHILDIGEENRHYGEKSPWGFGYGHVMFLNIRNLVQPVSRGHTLAGQFDPDYPPLCFCCDETREQGGIVIWCHNGQGMEAPVAAALGKVDGDDDGAARLDGRFGKRRFFQHSGHGRASGRLDNPCRKSRRRYTSAYRYSFLRAGDGSSSPAWASSSSLSPDTPASSVRSSTSSPSSKSSSSSSSARSSSIGLSLTSSLIGSSGRPFSWSRRDHRQDRRAINPHPGRGASSLPVARRPGAPTPPPTNGPQRPSSRRWRGARRHLR